MAVKKYLDYTGLAEVVSKFKERYGKAFQWKGSVANIAALPTISGLTVDNIGNVYNVIAAGITTADFVEGAGKELPANSNVVLTNVGDDTTPVLKWDVIGVFDISHKLTFATTMPSTPADGDIVLYLGPTTYTYAAFTPTYSEVTPAGGENPAELHWYEESGGVYSLTEDSSVVAAKTYYTCATNPSTVPLYEESSGVYTASEDTYVDPSKTYYSRTGEEFVQGVIYQYAEATTEWIALSSGDTFVPITNEEVDALFD